MCVCVLARGQSGEGEGGRGVMAGEVCVRGGGVACLWKKCNVSDNKSFMALRSDKRERYRKKTAMYKKKYYITWLKRPGSYNTRVSERGVGLSKEDVTIKRDVEVL